MTWSPHVTVACMVEHENKLLFVEESCEGKLVLNQPAGHVEYGESLQDAALRETLEEAACEVEIQALLGLYAHYHESQDISYYRICFKAILKKFNPEQQLDTGINAIHWLSPDEALKQENRFRSPMVKTCINDFMQGKDYPLEFIRELSF